MVSGLSGLGSPWRGLGTVSSLLVMQVHGTARLSSPAAASILRRAETVEQLDKVDLATHIAGQLTARCSLRPTHALATPLTPVIQYDYYYYLTTVCDTLITWGISSSILRTLRKYNGIVRLPSVLWRCWLGGRKGIRPVKNWAVGCWRGYLSGLRCTLAYSPDDATATHCLLLQ